MSNSKYENYFHASPHPYDNDSDDYDDDIYENEFQKEFEKHNTIINENQFSKVNSKISNQNPKQNLSKNALQRNNQEINLNQNQRNHKVYFDNSVQSDNPFYPAQNDLDHQSPASSPSNNNEDDPFAGHSTDERILKISNSEFTNLVVSGGKDEQLIRTICLRVLHLLKSELPQHITICTLNNETVSTYLDHIIIILIHSILIIHY